MADVTLSSGKEITIDLYKLTLREFRNLLDPERPNEEGDELLGRCAGMTVDDVGNLPYPDYRLLVKAVLDRARNPLANPNLESASTSD